MSDSRSQNSDNESSYARAHAEPYNAPSSRGSTSSPGTRNRSKTLGGGPEAAQPPSVGGGGRRPSLASVNAGARPAFKKAPPLPSPLNCVASEETQHATLGNELTPSAADRPINQSSQGSEDFHFSFNFPKSSDLGNLVAGLVGGQSGKQTTPNVNIGKKEDEEAKILTLGDSMEKPLDIVNPAQESPEPLSEVDGSSSRTRRPPPIAKTWLRELGLRGTAPSEKPLVSPSRSQTFPLPKGTNTAVESTIKAAQRRPSEPSRTSQSQWPLAPVTSASPEKPPMQAPLLRASSFSGRSYHSPSDSASSYGSVNSVEQSASSRSSEPLRDVEPRKEPETSDRHGQPKVQEAEILTPPKRPLVDYQGDSPTDPAFQDGHLTAVEPFGLHRTQTTPEPSLQTPVDLANDRQQHSKQRPLMRSKTTGGNKGQCRGCAKTIAANQKSVSSADGRLTGRYHKECFACTTCHSAFATADFYVLKDQPYCAQHYHALNGSLCGSCGHGIEGQYLEATRSEAKGPEKFHAKCFTCVMCRVVLKHDYFAHHGRFFCERDIHRVASPRNRSPNSRGPVNGAGIGGSSYLSAGNGMPRGKFPERRSTKLMIMS